MGRWLQKDAFTVSSLHVAFDVLVVTNVNGNGQHFQSVNTNGIIMVRSNGTWISFNVLSLSMVHRKNSNVFQSVFVEEEKKFVWVR